jgi:hypothetical protein
MRTIRIATIAAAAVLLSGSCVVNVGARSRQPESASQLIFRGNGGKMLSPFSVTRPSTLVWMNTGAIFQIFPSGGTSLYGSVNSQASTGWTYLPRGRYLLQINAVGNWGIVIRAGILGPHSVSGGYVGYTGNGGMSLPPFKAPRGEQLFWQASGSIFQIFSDGFSGVNVNSQAHRGSTYMSRGTQVLQINTTGKWTIAWKP